MKKRLALLLLPAVAGLGLWVSVAVDALCVLMLPFMMLLPFALGFALQGCVLFFLRRRCKWPRLVPLGLLLVPIVGAAREASMKGMFWGLAVFLWLGAAVLYLLGWTAAWALDGGAA